jgi:hypothetical protein
VRQAVEACGSICCSSAWASPDQMIIGICLLLGFWLTGKSLYLLVG